MKIKKLDEKFIVRRVIKYLRKEGFSIKEKKGIRGVDIETKCHPKLRRKFLIEAKGEAGIKKSTSAPIKHNAFYYMIGQIISRMDKEGNKTNGYRIYALAIPKKWETTFKNKIKGMRFGWRLLKFKVFLVDEFGKVYQQPYRYFLK